MQCVTVLYKIFESDQFIRWQIRCWVLTLLFLLYPQPVPYRVTQYAYLRLAFCLFLGPLLLWRLLHLHLLFRHLLLHHLGLHGCHYHLLLLYLILLLLLFLVLSGDLGSPSTCKHAMVLLNCQIHSITN